MELASYLAGERWSAHPACTHPLLAALARDVNDHITDPGRARLAELVPSVIGLTGDDLHLDARIALACARTALPVVAAGRQQIMAVSVLACERVLAGLDGRPPDRLEERSRAALEQVPHAAQWARSFTARLFARDSSISAEDLRQRSAPLPSMPRWRGSRWPIFRGPTRCSATCSSARSASAPPGPVGTPAAAPRPDTVIRTAGP
jgi:hypothetical protein